MYTIPIIFLFISAINFLVAFCAESRKTFEVSVYSCLIFFFMSLIFLINQHRVVLNTVEEVVESACTSACERRGSEMLHSSRSENLCVCTSGQAYRADYGRMFR